jgi:hypothetical protein
MNSWKDFAQLAAYLVQNADASGTPEAARRSAVSRMYYAAFCLLRDHAQAHWNFEATEHSADHARLRDLLRKRNQRELVSSMSDLQVWREMCDYRLTADGLETLYEKAEKEAQEIFDYLDRCQGK